ncbi:hypothetical protein [Bifidobacterium vansinderenii]|uniref:Uncharacterized protein n=1 Tax=Bifidobacterium vansinderenii TaxID=1984871 RepID=A0A229W1A2_9BIFI|nr:hypothetical protein [Bifidobacterium vansinderenii]OXN01642.1 hypothetical protein Tam10B_0084 [Bifidobacterium vansinderenii]
MSTNTKSQRNKIQHDYAQLQDDSLTTSFDADAMYVATLAIINIAETLERIAKTLENVDKQLQTTMARAWAEGYAANSPSHMIGPYHAPRNPYDGSTPEEE